MLQHGSRYRRELESQPNKLEALQCVLEDLFMHHHKALGGDVSAHVEELMAAAKEAYEFKSEDAAVQVGFSARADMGKVAHD